MRESVRPAFSNSFGTSASALESKPSTPRPDLLLDPPSSRDQKSADRRCLLFGSVLAYSSQVTRLKHKVVRSSHEGGSTSLWGGAKTSSKG